MSIFETIAERKIQEAIARGEFDNLSCKGKPLPPDDLDMVPDELWMSYKILKNAGVIPEEIELRKSIMNMQQLLNACVDENERQELHRKISEKQLRYNMIMESKGIRTIDPYYQSKILEKLK